IAPKGLHPLLDGPLEATEKIVNESEAVHRLEFERKSLLPLLQGRGRVLLIPGHLVMVLIGDRQTLALPRGLPAFVRPPGIDFRALRFADVAVDPRRRDARGGKGG